MNSHLTRRSLLQSSLTALVPSFASNRPFRFQHDHVLGTSMDLLVLAPSSKAADAAYAAAWDEIERLRRILSTYDPQSEISRTKALLPSHDLSQVLAGYAEWNRRTSGVISMHATGTLNVDALGKAYVIDRAALAAARASSDVRGLLLNIGGDIVARGNWPVAVADPAARADNAPPMTFLDLRDTAVATSGLSQRGAHILDPRTGRPAGGAISATVVAPDAVTANALSTALCVLPVHDGLRLVEQTAGAECLIVARGASGSAAIHRSSGFPALERPRVVRAAAPAGWQQGYEVSVTVTLKEIEGYRVHRPYVAVWAEDNNGKLVRNISVWARKPRWLPELHTWWTRNGGQFEESQTQPTRPPGKYRIVWDGVDDHGQPVPPGAYRIVVETNREHGDYAKQSGTIECGAKAAKIMLRGTGEFEDIAVEYGPRSQNA
jgi:FAD:protein FMN transferase